eukprot:3462053-Pyramimonas_sp.AAC.1
MEMAQAAQRHRAGETTFWTGKDPLNGNRAVRVIEVRHAIRGRWLAIFLPGEQIMQFLGFGEAIFERAEKFMIEAANKYCRQEWGKEEVEAKKHELLQELP